MDYETLQALIKVYRTRPSADLLSIIIDEAEGPQAQGTVLDLLRSADIVGNDNLAPARRKACQFCLIAGDFELAERLTQGSDLPEDLMLRARALDGLGRSEEAIAVYRDAIARDPAMRNRDLERLLGIRFGGSGQSTLAQVIPLTNYSSRRESKSDQERRDALADAYVEDFDDTAVTFKDVAGLQNIKDEILRRISLPYVRQMQGVYDKYKQRPGGNILLFGPPGCGKTLIARATAGETNARFLSVNPEEILDRYAGEAEKRLRVFFDEARSETPAVLFFDDFELLAFQRTGAPGEAAPALISAFLSELDGTQRNNSGLLTIAATNKLWALDRALLRAGRFHEVLLVPPPDYDARKRILEQALGNVPGSAKLPLDRIARRSAGCSGADLRALADRVTSRALAVALSSGSEPPVTTAMLAEALSAIGPSARNWMRKAYRELAILQREEPSWRFFFPIAKLVV